MLLSTRVLLRKKLRPGVLQKFREGMDRPEVIDDLAGMRFGSLQNIAVTPRYVDYNAGLGPLVFHHLNYSAGARGPHRPIVLRSALQGASKHTSWHAQLVRALDQHDSTLASSARTARWVPLPPGLDAPPPLNFAVGASAGVGVLLAPPVTSRAVSSQSKAAPLEAPVAQVAEPWRLGIGLDPFIRDTQRSVVRNMEGLGEQHVGPNEDVYFLPSEPLVFDITIPEDIIAMCHKANQDRAKKQYAAGSRSRLEMEGSSVSEFGVSSRHHTLRAKRGDVVFLPSQFSYVLSRPVGYESTTTGGLSHPPLNSSHTQQQQPLRKSSESHSLQPPAPMQVACLAMKYQKYPRLSDAQARLYIPADFTATRLDEFYRKGGNSLSPQYL